VEGVFYFYFRNGLIFRLHLFLFYEVLSSVVVMCRQLRWVDSTDDERVRIWKDDRGLSQVLSQQPPGRPEEKQQDTPPVKMIFRARYQLGTSRI
jgi:hypothetical protein